MSVRDTTGGTAITTPFTYDYGANENHLLGKGNIINDGLRIYLYDALNRLVQIDLASSPETMVVSYSYDPLGRRTQKWIINLGDEIGGITGDIPSGYFDYFYEGQQIVEEQLGNLGVWSKIFFWGRYVDELLFMATSVDDETVTPYRVLSDLLYRSVAIVATNNVIIEAYDTDAYGNTLCYSGPGTDGLWFTDDDVTTNNPINTTIFTGRQYDPESSEPGSSMYYYRARYYSPQIGRFIYRAPSDKRRS